MDTILEKLKQVKNKKDWEKWSLEEQKQLLSLYLLICKKEEYIFKLIYSWHGCDSWEDIFRDYDEVYLKDKKDGVQIALDAINEK
jgi:hypothetical protein